jgi:hypothetical protein
VGERAFGGWEQVDANEMLALQRSLDGTRRIPSLVAPSVARGTRDPIARYADVLGRLYDAIATVAGAHVVVDSSKHPGPAYLLRHVSSIDLGVVQIVRDPRGVAYSLGKTVRRPEGASADEYMSQWPPRVVARRWLTTNALIAGLRRFGVPVVRVRYEDLVADARGELRRIAEALGEPLPDGALDFVEGDRAVLPPVHSLDGNPMRFSTGPVPLRRDDAWRTGLPDRPRRLVSAATWPLRRRYGYGGDN